MNSLLNQRAALSRKINELAPAVNLPPEILTEIFTSTVCISDRTSLANLPEVEISFDLDWRPVRDEARAGAVFILAQVCSAWRNIILGTPQLWSNITIYCEHERTETQAEMLEYWLSKSGQCPLNVLLRERGHSRGWYEDPYPTEVIDVLVAHAHHLHTLDLYLPTSWKPALIRIANSVPLLTRLTLRAPVYDDEEYIERVNMFVTAPQLREVTLGTYHRIKNVSLPWAQLESLKAWYGDAYECLGPLRLCPRLRRLTAWLSNSPSQPAPTLAPIIHTALEELEIDCRVYAQMLPSEVPNALTLPALRSFLMGLEWGPWLPLFLSRVAGTLETLSHQMFEEEELLDTLRVVPKLRNLALIKPSYMNTKKNILTQRVLDLMNPEKCEELGLVGMELLDNHGSGNGAITPGADERGNGQCLVPNLETLYYEGEIAATPQALVEFLVARWRGPSAGRGLGTQPAGESLTPRFDAQAVRLRSATFKTEEEIEFEDSDWEIIERLQREGMHLEFEGPIESDSESESE